MERSLEGEQQGKKKLKKICQRSLSTITILSALSITKYIVCTSLLELGWESYSSVHTAVNLSLSGNSSQFN